MKRSVVTKDMLYFSPSLPLELWGEILSWLDVARVFRCATVCRAWLQHDLCLRSVTHLSFKESLRVNSILHRLVNLTFLEINSNFSGDLQKVLTPLVNLEHISLYWVRNVCDDTIKSLTKLNSLSLGSSSVTPEGLVLLPSLRSLFLDCYDQGMTDEGLARLTNLTSLSIYVTPRITGSGVSKLVNLKSLHLSQNHVKGGCFRTVTDETIHALTNLTSLTLETTSITDSGLTRLINLESLSLYESCITNKGLDKLPLLRVLDMYHSQGIEIDNLNPLVDVTYYPSLEEDD